MVVPAVMLAGLLGSNVRLGKALTGSFTLLDGQETIKGAAKVYTSLRERGTSNGDGKGTSPIAARMYDEWRASTVKMEPAAVR